MARLKMGVCITTGLQTREYYIDLLDSLKNQTFKDFKIYTASDISPIGKAKHDVVEMALKDNPEYIQMIDGDDIVEPTFIEEVVKRLDQGDADWTLCWGKLFGERHGYIHGSIEPLEELMKSNNCRHSWIGGKAQIFREINYNPKISWAEDWELWIRLDMAQKKGAIIEKELYLKRWHNQSLTVTHASTGDMTLHFAVTGTDFPYPYYLAIRSALKTQHIKRVKLWMVHDIKSKYLEELKTKIETEKVEIPPFPALEGKSSQFINATLNDYLNYRALYEEGGMSSGLDEFFIKDVSGLLGDKEIMIPRDIEDENHFCPFNTAVMITKKGNPIIKEAYDEVVDRLNRKDFVYGDSSCILISGLVKRHREQVAVPPYKVCGTFVGGMEPREPEKVYEDSDRELDPVASVIHMYAHASGHYWNEITPEYIEKSNSLYARTVRNVLTPSERVPWTPDGRRILRFHLLGLAHLPVSERYMSCAFTQKIVKLSKMLLSLGHEVYLYGSEGSDAPCTEFIQTHTLKDIRDAWGSGDNRFEIGYDWHTGGFRNDFRTEKTEATKKYYENCIAEINKRKQPDDFLLLSQGIYQKPIMDALELYLTCEPGIGYTGSMEKSFRAFESSYLQNFTYGSFHPFGSINGSHYDRVIPNYFDPKDFVDIDKVDVNENGYYLYIGRLVVRKGISIAVQATEAIGAKLILVGQQDPEINIKELPAHCEFLGYADANKRKELMAGAIATFTPTVYLEAFAGTHVESMLCGTPPITTNFGVFPETIPDYLNGKVGFRCNTLQDFVDAARRAKDIDRKFVRTYAERFLMDHVKWEFERWFQDLYLVWRSTIVPGELAWGRVI